MGRLLQLLTLLVFVNAVLGKEAHHGRRNSSNRRKISTTTSTTTVASVLFEEDEGDDVELAAAAIASQQDQPADGVETCEVARMKCAYRVGCGMALQNYMVGCSDVIRGSSQRCSDHCRNSLIALTSTEEGEALMKCKCGDQFCSDAKQRIDICRTAVLKATHNTTTVSCSVAQWICMADPLCSTALDYYHRFCRSMFTGKKCTLRCKNSISILRRQEKAAKLSTCVCDGSEDYDCPSILDNMDRLCFHKTRPATTPAPAVEGGGQRVVIGNEKGNSGRTGGSAAGRPHHSDHHPRNRPYHPHHPQSPPHDMQDVHDIESNEIETIVTPSRRPTPPHANRGPSINASLCLLASSVWTVLISSARHITAV